MKLYSSNEYYKLYHGSMLDMLEVIQPNTIDSVVTDPPYELNFMGKGWDNSGIAFQPDTWKKCYEVLKPGGYLLAFGGSRTFHRIAVAIEEAGFEIRDTIMWLYGSGFPKSMDISKQIDKRPNGGYSNLIKFGNYIKRARENKKLSKKELGKLLFNFDSNREDVPIQSWEIGKEIPKKEIYDKVKKILELNDDMDYIFEEAEREVIGTKKSGGASAWINGMNNKENEEQKYTGFSEWEITAPSTDLAKQWQGWGTALKPSFEPIIVARKPFKGSLVDNVIEYGVGGINIDECRVPFEDTPNPATNPKYRKNAGYKTPARGQESNGAITFTSSKNETNDLGRFPANTILTYDDTDYDEVCGGFPDTKSNGGKQTTRNFTDYNGGNCNSYMNISNRKTITKRIDTGYISPCDSGSASRYFYCAKASKKDRDEGLDTFNQEKVNDGRNTPIDNAFQRGETLRKNTHPTVKPTELMQYLVRLVSPDGATILDPFNGSGSTGKAVMYENKERNKNYKYIGIELTEEYLPIAKARIEYAIDSNIKVENEKKEDAPEGQLTIFDFES